LKEELMNAELNPVLLLEFPKLTEFNLLKNDKFNLFYYWIKKIFIFIFVSKKKKDLKILF
jgi:hypothetical protein